MTLLRGGGGFCNVPLKGCMPPCLPQHLCSVLLGRLRCAQPKCPSPLPYSLLLKSLIQPAEMLQFVDSRAICSPKDPLRCKGEEARLEPAAFSTLGERFSRARELIFLLNEPLVWGVREGSGGRWRHQLLLFFCGKSELDLWATVTNHTAAHGPKLIWLFLGDMEISDIMIPHAGRTDGARGFWRQTEKQGSFGAPVTCMILWRAAG